MGSAAPLRPATPAASTASSWDRFPANATGGIAASSTGGGSTGSGGGGSGAGLAYSSRAVRIGPKCSSC